MQRKLYDRVKSKTKASLILCFTGNVHFSWKDHCLLQLRAAGSAKARGNVIGQWLSNKRYNVISTLASQLDLFYPMTHVGNTGFFRINPGLAPKPIWFCTPASATHSDPVHLRALCAPTWRELSCESLPFDPHRIQNEPQNVSWSVPFSTQGWWVHSPPRGLWRRIIGVGIGFEILPLEGDIFDYKRCLLHTDLLMTPPMTLWSLSRKNRLKPHVQPSPILSPAFPVLTVWHTGSRTTCSCTVCTPRSHLPQKQPPTHFLPL